MTKVKICGLRTIEDVEAANSCLPDYVGFVFAEGSKRKINQTTAAQLKRHLRQEIQAVGVFVNQDSDYIVQLCQQQIIDLVQLHGEESDSYILELKKELPNKVIKSVPVGKTVSTDTQASDYLLFDTASVERGGSGKTFDWKILADYQGQPYFLAGGLTSENVDQAIAILQPYCLDVSSGIETDGKKDKIKMQEFVKKVQGASK